MSGGHCLGPRFQRLMSADLSKPWPWPAASMFRGKAGALCLEPRDRE